MKTAMELRSGNVIMVAPTRSSFRSRVQQVRPQRRCRQDEAQEPADRRASEAVYKADDKFEVVVLDKKEVTYSYFADPMYVFMDADYDQYEVEAENMVDALKYLEDGLACEVVFYNGKAISVELPNSVVREVVYTEPAVKGDTSGKVMKPARWPPASNCRFRPSSASATRSKSTPAPTNTRTASSNPPTWPHENRAASAARLHFRRSVARWSSCAAGTRRNLQCLPVRRRRRIGQQCFDPFAARRIDFRMPFGQHLGRPHPAHCKRAACRSRRDRPHRPD
jgi:elongation factor P